MSFILPPWHDPELADAQPVTGENQLQAEMRRIIEGVYGPPVRRLPGLDVGRAYRGAYDGFRYGGDMVDVFQFGDGPTSLAVVDISGHGISAASNAGLAKNALRAFASRGLDARDCVRALNRLCIETSAFEGDEEFFATVFFAIIDPSRRTMQYVCAGHEGSIVVDGSDARILPATGPIVGLLDADELFAQETIVLPPASIVAAVTDGFSEARNAAREFLGTAALVEVIERHRSRDAERQAEEITRFAFEYANEQLHDDVAALVVKVAS